MNSQELMDALEGISDSYILSAQRRRQHRQPRSSWRSVVAASIALCLCLGGSAVWLLQTGRNTEQMAADCLPAAPEEPVLGAESILESSGTEKDVHFSAAAMWRDFCQTAAAEEGFIPPEEYQAYHVVSGQHQEFLESLLESESLEPLGKQIPVTRGDLFYTLDLSSLFNRFCMDTVISNQYYYSGGTFQIEGTASLKSDGPEAIPFTIRRSVIGFLDPELYPQTGTTKFYTTSDYTEVTLSCDGEVNILVELSDCYISVSLPGIGEADWDLLQQFADSLSFRNFYQPERSAAFDSVLNTLITEYRLPDGTVFQPLDNTWTSEDKVGYADVTGDGAPEMILQLTNSPTAGMIAMVLEYDDQTGTVVPILTGFPYMQFYYNGYVKVPYSHNQGPAMDALWPYSLYQYNPQSGVFDLVAQVEAWSARVPSFDGKPYPAEADTSNHGAVYYLILPGQEYSLDNPMDITEYDAWLSTVYRDQSSIVFRSYPLSQY